MELKKKKVALNPGHIEEDDRNFLGPETEGGNNLKTCLLIKKHLEDNYIVDVVLVRQGIEAPWGKLGSRYPDADLFYSHHTNAFSPGKGTAKGTEVFYGYGRTLAQNIALRTATILETVVRNDEPGDNGAKRANGQLAVIKEAQAAGVKYQLLGEIGFHDNPKEVKLIESRRPQIAEAIAEEIAKYLNLEKRVIPVKVIQDPKNGPYINEQGEQLWFRAIQGSYLTRSEAQAAVDKMDGNAWLQAVYIPIKK